MEHSNHNTSQLNSNSKTTFKPQFKSYRDTAIQSQLASHGAPNSLKKINTRGPDPITLKKNLPAGSATSPITNLKNSNFSNHVNSSTTLTNSSPTCAQKIIPNSTAIPKSEISTLPETASEITPKPYSPPTPEPISASEPNLISTPDSDSSVPSEPTVFQNPSLSSPGNTQLLTNSPPMTSSLNSISNTISSDPECKTVISPPPVTDFKPKPSSSWASLFSSSKQVPSTNQFNSNESKSSLNISEKSTDAVTELDHAKCRKSDDIPSTSQPAADFSFSKSFQNGETEGLMRRNGELKSKVKSSPPLAPSFINDWRNALHQMEREREREGEREANSMRLNIIPRGLINTGNCCFMNSVLQSLLSCSPFLHLLYSVKNIQFPKERFPTLNAFCKFFSEFEISSNLNTNLQNQNSKINSNINLNINSKMNSKVIDSKIQIQKQIKISTAFIPYMFSDVISLFRPSDSISINKQEDAQEFLSFLLDSIHEELLLLKDKTKSEFDAEAEKDKSSHERRTAATNGTQNETWNTAEKNRSNLQVHSDSIFDDVAVSAATEEEEDEEWVTIGFKNRSSVLRSHEFLESELSNIFGGKFCSIVKSNGNKSSTTIQPFLLLHLEILSPSISCVEDALKNFSAPEALTGYKPKNARSGSVSAHKSVKLECLPPILILHLMRFSFQRISQGVGKIHKSIKFGNHLTLPKDLLAPKLHRSGKSYELIATVTHHGKESNGGHYTADTRQHGNRWLRFDDGHISFISLDKVLHDQAYLLFFQQKSS